MKLEIVTNAIAAISRQGYARELPDFSLLKVCIMKTIPHLKRRKLVASLACAAAALVSPFIAGQAAAQAAYPSKPITMVVSYPAGGDSDSLARLYAEKLTAKLGQNVIVENRPGASGTIGNAFVAKAPADGYTLLFTPNTISIATLVLKPGSGAAYDALNDFTPIIQACNQSLFMVSSVSSGLTNVKGVVEAAKANKLKGYGSPGSGSPMHILGELFNSAAGVKIQQIPYRGSAPSVIDLLGGQIPFIYTTIGSVQQHVASGKLAVVAVADAQRTPLLPNVPTIAEAGFKDVNVGAWQGLMGPKNLPADIVKTLNTAMNDILKMPDVIARMTTLGGIAVGGEPAVLARSNIADHTRYAKVIKEFGIQAD